MAKKTFVVRGSEDGNIGVYGNAGAAVDKATEYVAGEEDAKLEMTRVKYIAALNRDGYVDIERKEAPYDNGTAEIEMFYLNQ